MATKSTSSATPPSPDTLAASPPPPVYRILKINTCNNVTGKSTITYHVGCLDDESIHFRIFENSGGGYFSHEWVALKAMQEAFEKGKKPSVSFTLFPLFKGRSINTPAFILAAMVNEGLMQRDSENPRCYSVGDTSPFDTELAGLIASDISLQVIEKPKPKSGPVFMTKADVKKLASKKVKKDTP